jgi:pimeloyl-ACP methyl ester carboxylesterase
MPIDVIFPKFSLEAASGRIARWLVDDGDAVLKGQAIFEIDDDKAAVEVEAPETGVIRALADAATEVAVGVTVAVIEAGGALRMIEPEPKTDGPAEPDPAVAGPTAPHPTAEAAPATAAPTRADVTSGRPPNPTPLARFLAREAGIALDGIAGSGPRGRVQKRDLLPLLAAGGRAAAEPSPAAAPQAQAATAAGPGPLHSTWLRRGPGIPLVLLHGFASDLNVWRGLFLGDPAPAPAIAIDLPAHGRSQHRVPEDLDAVAAAVEATLAAAGLGRMVLVGHSFGGAVAARIASRGAVDIGGLCLFAPAGLGPEISRAFVEGILRATSAAALRPWLEELVEDPAVISDAFVAAAVEARTDAALTAAMTAFAARFFPEGTQSFSIRADLARLSRPARVVFGRDDRILPFSATRRLPGGVALHAVERCGHLPQLERPDLARRILAELIRTA